MVDLVSVIVPVYNVEKYLRKCMDTIINQSYSNLEIICVNDGSTDSSFDILKDYECDKRVLIIQKENGGLSSARNAGFRASTGNYIVFIDSDDYVELDYIEYLYNAISRSGADIAMCGYCIHKDDEVINYSYPDKIIDRNTLLEEVIKDENYKNYIWHRIYSRRLLSDDTFPEDIRHFEDVCGLTRMIIKSDKISLLPETKYHYIIRTNSLSQVLKVSSVIDRCISIQKRHLILAENNINFDEIEFNYYSGVLLYHLIPFLIDGECTDKDCNRFDIMVRPFITTNIRLIQDAGKLDRYNCLVLELLANCKIDKIPLLIREINEFNDNTNNGGGNHATASSDKESNLMVAGINLLKNIVRSIIGRINK